MMSSCFFTSSVFSSFFFNDTATTEIYTLSLHDALPIFDPLERSRELRDVRDHVGQIGAVAEQRDPDRGGVDEVALRRGARDRKSTRLNSSHVEISYAVFCLKKKKKR